MAGKKYSQGEYAIKNPAKYLGKLPVIYRSSWEISLMKVFDENPAVIGWSSESISIPYRNPLTGKWSMYLPDFFVVYLDKKNVQHVEIIEVKPEKENPFGAAGALARGQRNQLTRAINQAKFGAAMAYCQKRGWTFRVMTEKNLFGLPGRK